MNSSTRGSRSYRDAFVNHFEDRIAHQDMQFARPRRARQLEPTRVELFVDHDRPGAVPGQNLHAVASLPDEGKERPRSRLGSHPFSHHRAEPHIHRLQRQVDRQALCDHAAPPSSACTTARRRSASKPRRTWTSAFPTRTAIGAATSPSRTSWTNVGGTSCAPLRDGTRFSAPLRFGAAAAACFTQRYAVDAVTPNRAAASDTVARPSVTRSTSALRCSPV